MKIADLIDIAAPTSAYQPMYYNPTTDLIYRSSGGGMKTLATTITTGAGGTATLNYASLGLSAVPVVLATPVLNSTTTFRTAQITAVSTTAVGQSVTVVLAAQSMASSGTGVVVHVVVFY